MHCILYYQYTILFLAVNSHWFWILQSHMLLFKLCMFLCALDVHVILTRSKYHIAGNFRGRKLSWIGEKYDFCRENFRGLLACAVPKDRVYHAPKFCRENLRKKPTKTIIFVKVFSLESFPLYGISGYAFGGSCKPVAPSFIQDMKTLLCM